MNQDYFCNCLYFSANRLSRIMNKMAEEEFAPIGLSPTYAFLIMAVMDQPGINQKELSGRLHIAPSTSTRFVDKLVAKQIIERKSEGKLVYIYPTKKTAPIHEQIKTCWHNLLLRYNAVLGEEQGNQLTEMIHHANEKLKR